MLEGLLVVLAFVGIVLFLRLPGNIWFAPAAAAWGVATAADIFVLVRLITRARAESSARHRPAH